jgi:hypothetical protein
MVKEIFGYENNSKFFVYNSWVKICPKTYLWLEIYEIHFMIKDEKVARKVV